MNQIIPCVSDWKFSRDGVDWQNVSLPHSVFVEPETIVKPQVGKAIYQYRFSAPEEWKLAMSVSIINHIHEYSKNS